MELEACEEPMGADQGAPAGQEKARKKGDCEIGGSAFPVLPSSHPWI